MNYISRITAPHISKNRIRGFIKQEFISPYQHTIIFSSLNPSLIFNYFQEKSYWVYQKITSMSSFCIVNNVEASTELRRSTIDYNFLRK